MVALLIAMALASVSERGDASKALEHQAINIQNHSGVSRPQHTSYTKRCATTPSYDYIPFFFLSMSVRGDACLLLSERLV